MTDEPVVTMLPPTRLAETSFRVGGPAEVSAQVGPAFDTAWTAIHDAGLEPGVAVARYAMDAEGIQCSAGFVVDVAEVAGLTVVDLDATEAAVLTHHGEPSGISDAWMRLNDWVAANGYRPSSPGREYYRVSERGDEANWETDLQQPVARA